LDLLFWTINVGIKFDMNKLIPCHFFSVFFLVALIFQPAAKAVVFVNKLEEPVELYFFNKPSLILKPDAPVPVGLSLPSFEMREVESGRVMMFSDIRYAIPGDQKDRDDLEKEIAAELRGGSDVLSKVVIEVHGSPDREPARPFVLKFSMEAAAPSPSPSVEEAKASAKAESKESPKAAISVLSEETKLPEAGGSPAMPAAMLLTWDMYLSSFSAGEDRGKIRASLEKNVAQRVKLQLPDSRRFFGYSVSDYHYARFLLNQAAAGTDILDVGGGLGYASAQAGLAGALAVFMLDIDPACVVGSKRVIGEYWSTLRAKPIFAPLVCDILDSKFGSDISSRVIIDGSPYSVIFSQNLLHYLRPTDAATALRRMRQLADDKTVLILSSNTPWAASFETYDRAKKAGEPYPGYMIGDFEEGKSERWQPMKRGSNLDPGREFDGHYLQPLVSERTSQFHRAYFFIDKATITTMLDDAGWSVVEVKYSLLDSLKPAGFSIYDELPPWSPNLSSDADIIVTAKPKAASVLATATAVACSSCGAKPKTKLKRCSRCKAASYCNEGCQNAHWPAHKAECKAP
jgi:hypothetical protein